MATWRKESCSFEELQRIVHKLLDHVPVFRGLSGDELLHLLEASEKCTFGADETIVREGSTGGWMYVILDGHVSVLKTAAGKSTKLAELQAGDTLGEMSLVDQELRSASVIADTPCVLLRLSENTFWKNTITSAKIYRNLARILSRRLRDMDDAFVLSR